MGIIGLVGWQAIRTSASGSGPSIAIGSVTMVEGDGGLRTARIPVTLSEPSDTTVTVTVALTGGTATVATDFRWQRDVTLAFKPGARQRFVSVGILPDVVPERDEYLTLEVSTTGATPVARASGRVTIEDDDGYVAAAVPPISVRMLDVLSSSPGSFADLDFAIRNLGPQPVTFGRLEGSPPEVTGGQYVYWWSIEVDAPVNVGLTPNNPATCDLEGAGNIGADHPSGTFEGFGCINIPAGVPEGGLVNSTIARITPDGSSPIGTQGRMTIRVALLESATQSLDDALGATFDVGVTKGNVFVRITGERVLTVGGAAS